MKTDLSKNQTHILMLPAKRVEYRLRLTPEAIYAILEIPKEITRRRDRRLLARWQNAIHRRFGADPRPFNVGHIIEGRGALLALHTGDEFTLFVEGGQ